MIKAEEALKAFTRIDSVNVTGSVFKKPQSNWGDYLEFEVETEAEYQMDCDFHAIREFLRTPTFDAVVKAWELVCDYNVVHEHGFVTVGDNTIGGYMFASINIDKGIFDLPDNYNFELHNAINLTIRYLEGQKEIQND